MAASSEDSEQFRLLAAAARERSWRPVSELAEFMTWNREFFEQATAVLSEHLHPRFLPRNSDWSSEENKEALQVASTIIQAVFKGFRLLRTSPGGQLVRSWSTTCRWIDAIVQRCIYTSKTAKWEDSTIRDDLITIARVFQAASDPRYKLMTADMITPIVRLWLELPLNIVLWRTSVSAGTAETIVASFKTITWHMEDLSSCAYAPSLSPLIASHPDSFVQSAVAHIRRAVISLDGAELYYETQLRLACESMVAINQLWDFDPINEHFQYLASIPLALSLVKALTSSPFTPTTGEQVLKDARECISHIAMSGETRRAKIWMECAFKNKLLKNLSRLGPWLSWASRQPFGSRPRADAVLIENTFKDEVYPYIVYYSVLHAAERDLRKNYERYMSIDMGSVTTIWRDMLKTTVELRDMRQALEVRCARYGCQNVQDMHKYETCAGCEMAVYCSRECQKYDWKHGIHRKFCFSNQSHRSDLVQLSPQMTRRDEELRLCVLKLIVRRNCRKIEALIKSHKRNNMTIVEFNFLSMPPDIRAVHMHELPLDSRAEWSQMIVRADHCVLFRLIERVGPTDMTFEHLHLDWHELL